MSQSSNDIERIKSGRANLRSDDNCISANICVVESTRCPYCDEDFVSLGRHTWRCRARRTSSTPASTTDSIADGNNINNGHSGNTSYSPMSSQNQANVVFVKCSCGGPCKGRRGLRAHQRSCAVHNTLSAHNVIDRNSDNLELVNSDSTDVTAMDQISDQANNLRDINYSDSAEVAANDHISDQIHMQANVDDPQAHYKPGIKLPKTPSDWTMANAYFHSIFDFRDISGNLDQFVKEAQHKIYTYFQDNFGNIDNDNTDK